MSDFATLDPGIELVAASRGMSKGITQTDGPQIVVKPTLQIGPIQLAAQWKNLNSAVADGELALSVNASPKLGSIQLSLGLAYKMQTGVREPTDDRSWELSGSASRKFGKFGMRIAAVYSPDDLGSARRSLYVEGGPTLELSKTMRLSAGIGRRMRANGVDYAAFNAGLGKTLFKGVTLDLRWHDTNRSGTGTPYKSRIIIATRMAF